MQAPETNPKTATSIAEGKLYEADFYAWMQEQVRLLRHHQWSQIDVPNHQKPNHQKPNHQKPNH